MKIEHFRFPKSLWLILALAAGLRLLGASHRTLRYDESTHLACAETIDLRTGHLHLVFRSVDHPPLSVYVVKLSGYLFGDSNFGLRILHVLFGTATVLLIFLLGKRVFSEKTGLWAAALLAVDQFHLTWSYFIVPEILMLFFATLVLLQFLRATETRSWRDFVLLGLLLGFSYLAKETAILLFPILWLCIVINQGQRSLIWNPRWHLSHAIALLVIFPDILWNLTHFYEGYFYRDIKFLSGTFTLPFPPVRSLLLYMGEVSRILDIGPYAGYPGPLNLCHWPAGLLYLFAAFGAIRFWHQESVRVLLLTFFGIVLFFTLLPTDANVKYCFWWASISLIPSIIFGGWILRRLANYTSKRIPTVLAVILLVYLCFNAVLIALKPGLGVQRLSAAQRVESIIKKVSSSPTNSKITKYEWGLLHTLHIAGSDTNLYAYLARVACDRKQWNRAEYFARRSLELNEKNEIALQMNELLQESKR